MRLKKKKEIIKFIKKLLLGFSILFLAYGIFELYLLFAVDIGIAPFGMVLVDNCRTPVILLFFIIGIILALIFLVVPEEK